MQAYFNKFVITVTKDQALSCSHAGRCDDDVKQLARDKKIQKMIEKIDPDSIRAELKEYGAWDSEELADDDDNILRILWIAAVNIKESLHERSKI